MTAEPQRAFSQTMEVADSDALLPETPTDLGAIGSRKTLVSGPNMDSVDSDVFSSLSRCGRSHLAADSALPPPADALPPLWVVGYVFWRPYYYCLDRL